MGAKSALMIYADGNPAELLRLPPQPDEGKTEALVAATRLGRAGAVGPAGTLGDEIYPAEGIVYAGSFPGIDVLCDRDVMTSRPSRLPGHLLAPGAGRRVILHAMHSGSDWLGYAVWQDGILLRSLSLSPEDGITEDIGAPLPFEAPFWAGEHPVAGRLFPGSPPYPLPFHPLELGEAALLELAGFAIEGRPADYLIDPGAVRLISYQVTPASTYAWRSSPPRGLGLRKRLDLRGLRPHRIPTSPGSQRRPHKKPTDNTALPGIRRHRC